jgi:membrane protease YdiL (CAAX protease family)
MRVPVLGFVVGLVSISLILMLGLRVLFRWLALDASAASLPWFSLLVSVFCVLTPAILAVYWPPRVALGKFPSLRFGRLGPLLGILFLSGPIYICFASIELTIGGKLDANTLATGDTWLPQASWETLVFAWFALGLLPAISEEMLYRGVVQGVLIRAVAPWIAIVVTGGLFAVAHLDASGLLPRLFLGLWFGYLYRETGKLGVAIFAHLLNNSWALVLAALGVALDTLPGQVWYVAWLLVILGVGIWVWDWYRMRQAEENWSTMLQRTDEPRFIPLKLPESD